MTNLIWALYLNGYDKTLQISFVYDLGVELVMNQHIIDTHLAKGQGQEYINMNFISKIYADMLFQID